MSTDCLRGLRAHLSREPEKDTYAILLQPTRDTSDFLEPVEG